MPTWLGYRYFLPALITSKVSMLFFWYRVPGLALCRINRENGEKIQTGCVQCPLVLLSSLHARRRTSVIVCCMSIACNGNSSARACACITRPRGARIRARKTPLRIRNAVSAGHPRPTPRSCGRRVLTPLGAAARRRYVWVLPPPVRWG